MSGTGEGGGGVEVGGSRLFNLGWYCLSVRRQSLDQWDNVTAVVRLYSEDFYLKSLDNTLLLLLECCFTSTETVGLLGTGAQGGHLDFHTAPEV